MLIAKARKTIDFAGRDRRQALRQSWRGSFSPKAICSRATSRHAKIRSASSKRTTRTTDFFVLGNIQRIRGLAALADEDNELAVHHFSRGLTIFEAAEDVYHTALDALSCSARISTDETLRVRSRHLTQASDIFKRLGVKTYLDAANREFERLETHPTRPDESRSRDGRIPSSRNC